MSRRSFTHYSDVDFQVQRKAGFYRRFEIDLALFVLFIPGHTGHVASGVRTGPDPIFPTSIFSGAGG